MEFGRLMISFLLSVILVRMGRNLRMRVTGTNVMLVNQRRNITVIMVVAFFIYAALSGL